MIVQTIICNICEEPIPIVRKKDCFGIERDYYRFGILDFGKPFDNIRLDKMGLDVHICETCSAKLNMLMYKEKMEILLGGSNGTTQNKSNCNCC